MMDGYLNRRIYSPGIAHRSPTLRTDEPLVITIGSTVVALLDDRVVLVHVSELSVRRSR